jgi:hypothetical protein
MRIYKALIMASVVAATFFVGSVRRAEAHHRDFVFLRDWYLPFAGENEIEFRMTHVNRNNEYSHEIEFEHGVTDHFAIEPGIEWHQQDAERVHLDGMDVELRFNFGEAAMNKPLFALNVEYEHPFDSAEADRGELKFICSYFTPKGEDLSLNLNVGQELEMAKTKESEILFGYVRPIQKLTKEPHRGYKIGLRGGFEASFDFQEHFLQIGPTIAFEQDEHFNIIAHLFFAANKPHENSGGFRIIGEWEF